jgi:lysophospholipase L1-like esterase
MSRPADAKGRSQGTRLRTSLRLLLAILSMLVLLEIGARLLLPARSYEDWRRSSLRYTYEPFYHWSLRAGEYRSPGGRIRINSYGLRGDEFTPEKEPDTIRILVLGGSAAFNYHAAGGQTWPRRLEAYLRRSLNRKVEVINAGTPGYSLYQSSMRFQHQLVSLDPDLVLVYHLWNDLTLFWIEDAGEIVDRWDLHGRYNEVSTLLDPFPFLDALCARSQFVTHLRFAGLGLLKRLRRVDEEGWVHRVLDKRVTPAGLAFYRSNLERVADTSASRGIPLGIIDQALLPVPESTRLERRRIRYEYTGFDHSRLLEAIADGLAVNREVALRKGVWQLGVEGVPRNLRHMRDHVHLTDAGLVRLVAILAPQVLAILRSTTEAAGPGEAPEGGRLSP